MTHGESEEPAPVRLNGMRLKVTARHTVIRANGQTEGGPQMAKPSTGKVLGEGVLGLIVGWAGVGFTFFRQAEGEASVWPLIASIGIVLLLFLYALTREIRAPMADAQGVIQPPHASGFALPAGAILG